MSTSPTTAKEPVSPSTSKSDVKSAPQDVTSTTQDDTPEKAVDEKEATPEEKEAEVEAPADSTGIIDMETFQQIRDMDDDEDEEDEDADPHEFSKGIVWGFFEQADTTFQQMEDALAKEDLEQLSSLGHFLKGSSAALGIIKVQAICEKMQHYGHKRDEEAGEKLSAEEALKRIATLLKDCKRDYRVAKAWLVQLYAEE